MSSSNNLEFLFKNLRPKFDELCFWREIELFIENGLIVKIPLDVLPEGGLYLQSESLTRIIYQYDLGELQSNEEQFN